MSSTTLRSDVRTRIRDYMYESSAGWFTEAQINRLIDEEIQSLSMPSKNVYLEALYTTSLVKNQLDYVLPTGTKKIERIERNQGTASIPDWTTFTGWDIFNGAIYLDYPPKTTDTIRAFIRKAFAVPTGDVTYLDMPNEVTEILVWGVVIRCYKMVIGYLRNAQNWDSIAKPDYLTVNTAVNWLQEAKRDYDRLINAYKTIPRPRDINLVS